MQKTMTITAAEYFDSFPGHGAEKCRGSVKQEAIDRLWDRSIAPKNDEKRVRSSAGSSIGAQYAKGEAKARITFF
ncbi:hypothetical protein AB2I13_24940 (plasmid) [Escherichia coli]